MPRLFSRFTDHPHTAHTAHPAPRSLREHALFEPCESRRLFASIAWDGGGDGTSLTQAANWAGDVLPGASDDAVINIAGTPTIALSSGAFSVHSLSCAEAFNMSGGTLTIAAASDISGAFSFTNGAIAGAGDLAINGTFNWPFGIMGGTGTTTLGPASVATLGGVTTQSLNRNLVNNGTINWSSAAIGGQPVPGITLTNNGTINANIAGTTLFQGNSTPNTLINHGTFNKTGAGTLTFQTAGLINTGTLAVSGGDLSLTGGGGLGGTITIGAGAFLDTNGGNYTDTAATISGAGTLRFQSGTHTLGGGGAIVDNAITTIDTSTIGGTGNLTFNAAITWNSGTISTSGTVTVNPGITLTMTSFATKTIANCTFVNNGTINHDTGFFQLFGNATFNNNPGKTYNLSGLANLYATGGGNTFTNAGTLNITTNQNPDFTGVFNNSGTLNVATGQFFLDGGGTNSGPRTIAAGALLAYRADYTHAAGSTATGAGALVFYAGTQTISGSWTTSCWTQLRTGTLTGAGNLTIAGPFAWAAGTMSGPGTTTVLQSGTLAINAGGSHTLSRTTTSSGQLQFSSGTLHMGGATLTNTAAGTFSIIAYATIDSVGGASAVINAGTLRKMAPTNTAFGVNPGDVSFSNTGFIDNRNGSLRFNGPIVQMSGTTLTAGTWQVYPAATLDLASATIQTIGAAATVNLVGGNAHFAALNTLTTNAGTLNLTNGGMLQVSPIGGTFTNSGAITMGPDRGIRVQGNFAQTAAAHITFSFAASNRYSRIVATGIDTLAGSITLTFTGYTPAPATPFYLFQGTNSSGAFATATIPTFPGHQAHLNYQPGLVSLIIT